MSYKAFISYSHAADGHLAPMLQAALQKFAKPFYRLRALRIFRDETSLQLTPALWPTIQKSMSESEFFILMASPAAASSHWVQQEVSEWMRLHNDVLDRFLIVLTDGAISWSIQNNDFDWESTTAIPSQLRGKFPVEPLFLDFRWAREAEQLSLRNPAFLRGIARLAAVLHHRDLDSMIGEDLRQHRRFRIVSTTAITLLILLTILAGVAAFYAYLQKNTAEQQQENAENNLYVTRIKYAQQNLDIGNRLAGKEALKAYIPVKNQPDRRGFEWYYLWRQFHQEKLLIRLADPVHYLDFSSDGNQLVMLSGKDSKEGLIILSNSTTGQRLGSIASTIEHRGYRMGRPVALSTNGKIMAAAGKRFNVDRPNSNEWDQHTWLHLWKVSGNSSHAIFTEWRKISLPVPSIGYIAFFPGNRHMAIMEEDAWPDRYHRYDSTKVWIVDCESERVTASWPIGLNRAGKSLEVSADGNFLAVRNDGRLRLINTSRPNEVVTIGDSAESHAIKFSPDTKLLAIGRSEGSVKLIDVKSPQDSVILQEESEITGKEKPSVRVLQFSKNGQTLVTNSSWGLCVWDVSLRQHILTYKMMATDHVESIFITNTGKILATGNREKEVRIWEVRQDPVQLKGLVLSNTAALAPDGMTLAISFIKPLPRPYGKPVVRLLQANTLRHLKEFPVIHYFRWTTSQAPSVLFSPNGNLLGIGAWKGTVELWNPANGEKIKEIRGWKTDSAHDTPVQLIGFTSDGRFIGATNRRGAVKMWDVASGKVVFERDNGYSGGRMSPNGKTLVLTRTDSVLEVLEAKHFRTRYFIKRSHQMYGLDFSPDSRTLALIIASKESSDIGNILLIDTESGKTRQVIHGLNTDEISDLTFSPDGRTMVTAGAGQIKFWSTANYEELLSLRAVDGYPTGSTVQFSPNGEYLIIGDPYGTPISLLWARFPE